MYYFNIDIHCIYNNFNIDIHCIYYNCGSVLKGVWHEICLLLQGSPALPSWKSNGRSKQNAFTAKEIRIICTVNFYPSRFILFVWAIWQAFLSSLFEDLRPLKGSAYNSLLTRIYTHARKNLNHELFCFKIKV